MWTQVQVNRATLPQKFPLTHIRLQSHKLMEPSFPTQTVHLLHMLAIQSWSRSTISHFYRFSRPIMRMRVNMISYWKFLSLTLSPQRLSELPPKCPFLWRYQQIRVCLISPGPPSLKLTFRICSRRHPLKYLFSPQMVSVNSFTTSSWWVMVSIHSKRR